MKNLILCQMVKEEVSFMIGLVDMFFSGCYNCSQDDKNVCKEK